MERGSRMERLAPDQSKERSSKKRLLKETYEEEGRTLRDQRGQGRTLGWDGMEQKSLRGASQGI